MGLLNKKSSLDQAMPWHRAGDKPLQDPMMTMPHFKLFQLTCSPTCRAMGHETVS